MDTLSRVNELLQDHEMTLYELCKKSGICYSTFGAMKRRSGQLSIDTIERVCDTLGIRPFEFFMSDSDWAMLEDYILRRHSGGGRS